MRVQKGGERAKKVEEERKRKNRGKKQKEKRTSFF
jgi:hypothetical protein